MCIYIYKIQIQIQIQEAAWIVQYVHTYVLNCNPAVMKRKIQSRILWNSFFGKKKLTGELYNRTFIFLSFFFTFKVAFHSFWKYVRTQTLIFLVLFIHLWPLPSPKRKRKTHR